MVQSDTVLPRLIRSLDATSREAAVEAARHAVAPYGVLDRPDWQAGPLVSHLPPADQDRLFGRVGELLFLMTQSKLDKAGDRDQLLAGLGFSDRAAPSFAADKAWWEQRAALLAKLGEADGAARAADEAKRLNLTSTTDRYFAGLRLYEDGRSGEALPFLVRVTDDDPRHFKAWFLRGNCHFLLGQFTQAASCYSACISIDPAQAPPYFNRSRVFTRHQDFVRAADDADRAAGIDPDWVEARIDAALARYRLALALVRPASLAATRDELLAKGGDGLPADQTKLLRQAEERLTAILRLSDPPTRCFFHRADVRQILGDKTGAAADREQGFARGPAADDDVSWVVRGLHRPAQEAAQALEDFRRAERINPQSISALKNQAHILTEPLNRLDEALTVQNRLLALYPELPEARVGRAVLLARLGRMKEALADAEWAKAHAADPLVTYMAGGVYARAGDTREALRLLASALTHGFGFNDLATDPELDPIRGRPEFARLVDAVRTLQELQKPAEKSPAPATFR